MPINYGLLFAAATAICFFFIIWGAIEAVAAAQRRYRTHIHRRALYIVQKHPEYMAAILREGGWEPKPTTAPVLAISAREPDIITAEIVLPDLADPYAEIEAAVPQLVETPRVVLAERLLQLQAEKLAAEHEVERQKQIAARKDRTRAMYLRRLRRVDAVVQAGTEAFAALHPSLARAAA